MSDASTAAPCFLFLSYRTEYMLRLSCILILSYRVHVTSIMHGRMATRRKREGRKTDEEKEKEKAKEKKKKKAELRGREAGITYVVTDCNGNYHTVHIIHDA